MDEQQPLKIYFIPYLAAGHMIPLCDIAKLFASRGQHVTIITTPSNAQFLQKSISNPLLLRLHAVPFPSKEVGLPDGVESMTALTNLADSDKVYKAAMLLQGPIGHFIEQNPPNCIVADYIMDWVGDLANKLQIPRLAFNGFCLFTAAALESVRKHRLEADPFSIPNFPHHITLRARPPKALAGFMEYILEIELKSHGLIVNNFAELDGEEYIDHYERTTGHKAWHLGPVSLTRGTEQEKAERGQKSAVSSDELLSWLNSKPLNSVVYICFGSVCHFPDKQLYEIASAVESSGYGFIWVVPEKKGKEDESEEEKEKWLPKGFEERNREKGLVVRGWAPQVVILNHPTVGAFVTHCGWNSAVEAVSAGVPMITWPVHSEQFYNEKLITEVRGIGVEVGATEWCHMGFDKREKLVSRESIEKAVRRVMDGGDEAKQIRQRAQEYGKKARQAVEEGGSSHKNLTALIDDLKRLSYSPKCLH